MHVPRLAVLLLILACAESIPSGESNSGLAQTVEDVKGAIQRRGLKKIKVLRFEAVGSGTEAAGRYVSDELTVALANTSRSFAIAESSQISPQRLAPPSATHGAESNKSKANAPDGVIVGTVYFGTNSLLVFTKVLDLAADDVIYSAETKLSIDSELRSLLGAEAHPKPVVRECDGVKFQFNSLRIANGRDYILSVDLVNTGGGKRWVAIDTSKSLVRDSKLFEFEARGSKTIGVLESGTGRGRRKGSELAAERPQPVIIYFDASSREASAGPCELQLVAEVGTTPDGEFEERAFVIRIPAVMP